MKWQISNFCAFQKAVSILRNPEVVLFNINSIGYQRPAFCLKRESMNCRQLQRYASFDNLAIVRARQWIGGDNDSRRVLVVCKCQRR